MRYLSILICIFILVGCSENPTNTYILTFTKTPNTTLKRFLLPVKADGVLIKSENDSLAYQTALLEFYQERFNEEKLAEKATTTGFTLVNHKSGKQLNYSILSKPCNSHQKKSLQSFL